MVIYGGIIIMKIKQQKNIKAFLNEEFGEKRGNDLFNKQEAMLNELIKNTQNKSKNQMKTLIQTILPRIAMYKILSKEEVSEDEVYQYMRKYMIDKIAVKKHASTAKMRTTDLQESVQKHGKDYFDVTIKKCLWHTACVENDCEKLCHLFCDVDNVTYGGLKKIGFSRTKTLGYGGDCCDFHFYKK